MYEHEIVQNRTLILIWRSGASRAHRGSYSTAQTAKDKSNLRLLCIKYEKTSTTVAELNILFLSLNCWLRKLELEKNSVLSFKKLQFSRFSRTRYKCDQPPHHNICTPYWSLVSVGWKVQSDVMRCNKPSFTAKTSSWLYNTRRYQADISENFCKINNCACIAV